MRFKTIVFALIGSLIAFSSCEKEDAEDIKITIETGDDDPNLDSRLIGNWHSKAEWKSGVGTWGAVTCYSDSYLFFSSDGIWQGYTSQTEIHDTTRYDNAGNPYFQAGDVAAESRWDFGSTWWVSPTVTDSADGYLITEDMTRRYYFYHQGDSLFIENWGDRGIRNRSSPLPFVRRYGRE